MGQNLKTINKRTESKVDELKVMFLAMSKLLADENIKQNLSRNKLSELETWIGCLAQSSISPDTLKEIKTSLDILAKNSMAGNDSDNINNELNTLRVKLSQVYMKMQGTEELCVNICKSVDGIGLSDDDEINKGLQKQLKVIKQIKKDNEMYMNEILQQINNVSPICDNETQM